MARYSGHPTASFVSAAAPSAGTGFSSVRHSYCPVVQALRRLDREPTRVLLIPGDGHHKPHDSLPWVETGTGRSTSYPFVFETDRFSRAPPAVAAAVPCRRRSRVMLADPEGAFLRNYNRKPFAFAHGLAGHPLFELNSLIELSRRMPDHRDTYWSNGKVQVTNGWLAGTSGRQSLQDTIANIATNDSIVILKHTEQDPVHGPVLQEFLGLVVELAGERMRADVTIGETLILISSPNRLTPYHMDAETNFLVQVRGDKWFHVFDQDDRGIISDFEREQYFAGDLSSAVYEEERQKDAVTYDLHAGYGVHVPVGAPHWVQNKDNVSVAISVNYELRSVERLTRIYQMNHRLRRLGVEPRPPGQSALADGIKLAAGTVLSRMRSAARTGSSEPRVAVWTPSAARQAAVSSLSTVSTSAAAK